MTSRFSYLQPGFVVVLGICVGGCLSDGERHSSTPHRQPAMPKMAPGTGGISGSASDTEILAVALRSANGNDMEGVSRALKSVSDASRRAQLAIQIVTQHAENDPRSAAKLALALAGDFELIGAIDVAARSLVRRDPEYALRWSAENSQGVAGGQMLNAVVDELVQANPRRTIEEIGAFPAGAARDDLLVLAAGAWARRDPDAAISWLGELPDDGLKQRLTSSVGFALAQTRPDRALAVAELLPEGRNRWLLFSAIAQTWVAVDSKAALAWAGKLPAGEPRDAAFAGIDTGYGIRISRRNAGAPNTRSGSSRTRGGGAAAAAWPEVNSPAFAVWLAAQPPGMSREEAILEYVRQRGALDPAGTAPLIETLPPGPTRDQAMAVYVDGLLLGSPAEAARWVRSLPRSERSDELIEKTARRWLLTNPDAAAEWIQQTPLPLYQKERLLREAGR